LDVLPSIVEVFLSVIQHISDEIRIFIVWWHASDPSHVVGRDSERGVYPINALAMAR